MILPLTTNESIPARDGIPIIACGCCAFKMFLAYLKVLPEFCRQLSLLFTVQEKIKTKSPVVFETVNQNHKIESQLFKMGLVSIMNGFPFYLVNNWTKLYRKKCNCT